MCKEGVLKKLKIKNHHSRQRSKQQTANGNNGAAV